MNICTSASGDIIFTHACATAVPANNTQNVISARDINTHEPKQSWGLMSIYASCWRVTGILILQANSAISLFLVPDIIKLGVRSEKVNNEGQSFTGEHK